MERYQLDDERAFAFLARLSQQRNVKLRVVAEEIIADVTQRGNGDER
jgi:AmiR/NasT family two-component response regulator